MGPWMLRGASILVATFFVMAAGETRAAGERALVFHFTPTARAQIAVWIEKPDGTFLATVGLTQAVSVRGIGNRPGATQMNSGYHWPYGRREGVLPIWAHRRAAAPGAGQFPRVIFQNRLEGYASRTCEDSTLDKYFCLAFTGNTNKDGLDAMSCASPFMSDKGRILTDQDVKAGYAEPTVVGGQSVMRALPLISLYPPRRDYVPCAADAGSLLPAGCDSKLLRLQRRRGLRRRRDRLSGPRRQSGATPQKGLGFAEAARAAMPDIDAVTMATPPADVAQAVMYSVPGDWPSGDYVAWLEINTEGDYNGVFSDVTFPTPAGSARGMGGRSDTGYPYRGQPSVVFSVPFSLAASGSGNRGRTRRLWVGRRAGVGRRHDARDGWFDHRRSGGQPRQRCRPIALSAGRKLSPCRSRFADGDFCKNPSLPGAARRAGRGAGRRFETLSSLGSPSLQRAGERPAHRQIRSALQRGPIVAGDPDSFIRGLPALAASEAMEALMVPVSGPAGSAIEVDFGGLDPSTHYWIAVRAVDVCNRAGPHAVAEVTTTRINYTQLSGPCFIATAAWGSALEPTVAAMRRARNQLLAEVPLFAVAADLYGRSGPAAAGVLRAQRYGPGARPPAARPPRRRPPRPLRRAQTKLGRLARR